MSEHVKIGAFVGVIINALSACGRSTEPMDSAFFFGLMLGAVVGGALWGALLGKLGHYLFGNKETT